MFFSKALLAGAFAAVAYAQSDILTFTSAPDSVTAGEPREYPSLHVHTERASKLTYPQKPSNTPPTTLTRP